MTGGRIYGGGIEDGRILVAPAQYALMNPSMQQDFVLVRTLSGVKMYVRKTDPAIARARQIHEIVLDDEWIGKQDPAYLQFLTDVRYIMEILHEQYLAPRWEEGRIIGRRIPEPTKDDEEFVSISIQADADECPDYLCAVVYTAFREMKIDAHPAVEHQFDTYWTLYIVD